MPVSSRSQHSDQEITNLKQQSIRQAQKRNFDDAIQLIQQALKLDGENIENWTLLARMCVDANRLEDAERHILQRLRLQPTAIETYRQLAGVRKRLGKMKAAVEVLNEALVLMPKAPELYVELGLAHSEMQKKNDAKAYYLKALELDPDHFDAHNNLAVVLQDLRQLDGAIKHLRRAVELKPDQVSGLNNLGVALADKRQFAEAIEFYRRALKAAPKFAMAWNNLGNALRSIGRSEGAIESLEKAIALKPDYAEAYNNLAITYAQVEDSSRALTAFDKALFLRPDYPEGHMNRGLQHLLLGNFPNGWADYEWRWHEKLLKPRRHALKRWDGSPLIGKKVLLHYEQGLGDTIHFIRYAAELKSRGATVIFECQPILRQILSRTPGIDQFIQKDQKPRCDFGAPLLSLPGAFQTNSENLPCTVPYISADPKLVETWRERMAGIPGFRVGIAWQGKSRAPWRLEAVYSTYAIWGVGKIRGCHVNQFAKGSRCRSTQEAEWRLSVQTFDGIGEDADGFEHCGDHGELGFDYSADTSLIHLAGAMGLPRLDGIASRPGLAVVVAP